MTAWRWMPMLCLAAACATTAGSRRGDAERAQLALAHQLEARQDWPALMQLVDRMHQQGRRSAQTLTLRASAFRGQGAVDEAEADLRGALDLDSKHAPAHAELAVILDVRRKFEEAEKHHLRALDLEPESPEYLNNWGFSLFVRGRSREAVEVLRRAADGAPLVPRYRNNLGFAYARAGDFARAAQQFALGGVPAEARNNLGFAYELADNLPQAFEAYREAVRLDRKLTSARSNLAYVAERLHRALPPELSEPAGEERRVQ